MRLQSLRSGWGDQDGETEHEEHKGQHEPAAIALGCCASDCPRNYPPPPAKALLVTTLRQRGCWLTLPLTSPHDWGVARDSTNAPLSSP